MSSKGMREDRAVTVIICTWNRCESLLITLNSLSEQKGIFDCDLEIIIVDNNSTDQTKNTFEQISENWKLGQLRYIFEPRQGKQFALNAGINAASHEILLFSDDDIKFKDDWILTALDRFGNFPSLELFGGKTLAIWPATGKPKWFDTSMSAVVGVVDLGDIRIDPAPDVYCPSGANTVARKSLFDAIGKYSERHFRHMDHEFGMRCQLRKRKISYEPTMIVYAPVDEKCLTKRYFRKWSFKAGIANIEQKSDRQKTILYVERWIYGRLIQDLVWLTVKSWRSAPDVVFSRELRIWRDLGTICNAWHDRFFHNTHSEWVKNQSQKINNNY